MEQEEFGSCLFGLRREVGAGLTWHAGSRKAAACSLENESQSRDP